MKKALIVLTILFSGLTFGQENLANTKEIVTGSIENI